MKKILAILPLLFLLMTACDDPFMDTTFVEKTNEDLELSNAEYLMKHQETYSLWIELLKHANMYNALNDASSSATIFAPTNEAMTKFLNWKGVASVEELDKEYARYVAQIHTMKGVLKETDFVNYLEAGSIPVMTLFGTYLTPSYGFRNLDVDDDDLDQVVLEDEYSIYLNNQAKVANLGRAVVTTNGAGIVYTMDDVIRPLSETFVDVLRPYKDYNIFIEAMELTGYDKIASVYADTVTNIDGSISVTDIRFTCFAVPDEVYEGEGINSVNDLISHLGASSNYGDTENALYQYIAYHFMGKAYTKAALCEFQEVGQILIYDTKYIGQVMTVESGIDNKPRVNGVGGFIRSNIKTRNGYIHRMNHMLPVYEPKPVRIVWDFCNSPDIESFVNSYGADKGLGELFSSALSNREYQIDLSEDMLEGNYGTITSFEYKYTETKSSPKSWRRIGFFKNSYASSLQKDVDKYGANMNNLLILNLGYAGSVTMKTPTIIKGKYKVILYYAGAPGLKTFYANGSSTRFNLDDYQKSIYMWKGIPASFVDDEKKGNVNANGIAADVLWDQISFDESGSHTFKATLMDINAKTNSSYRQMWDCLEFIPIEE